MGTLTRKFTTWDEMLKEEKQAALLRQIAGTTHLWTASDLLVVSEGYSQGGERDTNENCRALMDGLCKPCHLSIQGAALPVVAIPPVFYMPGHDGYFPNVDRECVLAYAEDLESRAKAERECWTE